MFERVMCPVFNAPEKYGLFSSRTPALEKMVATISSCLKTSARVLVLVSAPISASAVSGSEAKYVEIFKRMRQHFNCFVVNIIKINPK